ncbi:MAG: hypothetical protein R3F46_06480 [bacterium]
MIPHRPGFRLWQEAKEAYDNFSEEEDRAFEAICDAIEMNPFSGKRYDEDADGEILAHYSVFYIKGQPWHLLVGYSLRKNSNVVDLRVVKSIRKKS